MTENAREVQSQNNLFLGFSEIIKKGCHTVTLSRPGIPHANPCQPTASRGAEQRGAEPARRVLSIQSAPGRPSGSPASSPHLPSIPVPVGNPPPRRRASATTPTTPPRLTPPQPGQCARARANAGAWTPGRFSRWDGSSRGPRGGLVSPWEEGLSRNSVVVVNNTVSSGLGLPRSEEGRSGKKRRCSREQRALLLATTSVLRPCPQRTERPASVPSAGYPCEQ